MNLEEILPKLQEWFAPEEHKDRTLPGGGRWFFVPHQSITQRLNAVCPGHWHTKVNSTNIAGDYTVVMVELTICGVTRTGIGDDKTFPELNEQGKAKVIGTPPVRAFRSAFKDAAEQFGICAYLDDQKANRNEFAKYMAKKGDQRANKFITENGWVEQPTQKPEAIGRDSLMKSIKQQIDRLKWTSVTEAEYLLKTFNAKERIQLSNNQLSSYLGYLRTQEIKPTREDAPKTPAVHPQDLRVKQVRTLLNYPVDLVVEWLKFQDVDRPNQLPPTKIDELIKTICLEWAADKFDHSNHAANSYQKYVVDAVASGADEVVAIRDWMNYVVNQRAEAAIK